MVAGNVDRADARIMAAHLFTPEERAALPAAVPDAAIAHPESESSAREAIERAADERWEHLLSSRVRLHSCTWKRDVGYFTDRTLDRWKRVAFVEVRAEGADDPFDRVVFPSWPDLPEGILPLLDGKVRLEQLLRESLRGVPTADRATRLSALRQQVRQLDFAGFLELGDESGALATELPSPVAAALADVGGTGWTAEVDMLGETLTLRRDGDADATVMLAQDVPTQRAYARTATTRFWHPGARAAPQALRLMAALTARFRAWETKDPGAARRFWEGDILRLPLRGTSRGA
jgi:hypothetical protein